MSEHEAEYERALDRLLKDDPRYSREAYMFIQAALDYYQRRHRQGGAREHVSGPELLDGIRELAIAEYGPLARSVLNHWGLERGEDVGEIVYNLIGVGLMAKTTEDRREDFDGVMAFDETMDQETSW